MRNGPYLVKHLNPARTTVIIVKSIYVRPSKPPISRTLACRPRHCGRFIRDNAFNESDLISLRTFADGLMNLTGGASGGVSTTVNYVIATLITPILFKAQHCRLAFWSIIEKAKFCRYVRHVKSHEHVC